MKDIKLKNPNSYSKMIDVPRVDKLPDSINPSDLLLIVYSDLSVSTTHGQILETIQKMRTEDPDVRSAIYGSIVVAIESTRSKIEQGLALSDAERDNLADDIVLAVCIEHVYENKPIPVAGVKQSDLAI